MHHFPFSKKANSFAEKLYMCYCIVISGEKSGMKFPPSEVAAAVNPHMHMGRQTAISDVREEYRHILWQRPYIK